MGSPLSIRTRLSTHLGIALDDILSFNDHMDYVTMKVSKILRMFSRTSPSLTLEAANSLYKGMAIAVLDYLVMLCGTNVDKETVTTGLND